MTLSQSLLVFTLKSALFFYMLIGTIISSSLSEYQGVNKDLSVYMFHFLFLHGFTVLSIKLIKSKTRLGKKDERYGMNSKQNNLYMEMSYRTRTITN